MTVRTYRAGSAVEDYCRACKLDRMHTVVAADAAGQPIRVKCGYCSSEHNYRGGPRTSGPDPRSDGRSTPPPRVEATASARIAPQPPPRERLPLVSDRELAAAGRNEDVMTDTGDLERLLRRVIREETGLTPVAPADRWRTGTLVLRPGSPGLQEKTWPIETFFHKIVMIRNRLRTLEQAVNASELPDDVKVKLQSYVTGCYGSLTSFNVLFADEDDHFKGAGGGD